MIVCLAAALGFFVNAVWSWRVPYVRIDESGLTTYPAIVAPPRTVAWTQVKNVRSKANGRLYLLDADFNGMSVRIKTVAQQDRAELLEQIAKRSGRRLLPMPAKSARSSKAG